MSTGTPNSATSTIYSFIPQVMTSPLRSSSVQATSALASSSDFGATQLAWALEVSNTFIALGIWKGSA